MTQGEPLPTALPYLEENDVIDTTAQNTAPEAEQDTAPPEVVEETPPLTADDQPEGEPQQQAQPQPDINTQFQKVLEMQQQNLELQRQQFQPPAQPQPQYVPLQQREDWRARYENALSAASYDESARRELMTMQSELVQEQVQQAVAPMQQRLQMETRADHMMRSGYAIARQQFGDGVTEADYQQVIQETFGADRAAVTQALDPQLNPNAAATQRILADAAAGRALREGRLRPAAPTPTPPVTVRGANRAAKPAAPARSNTDMWNDPDFLNSIDLYDLARRNRQ